MKDNKIEISINDQDDDHNIIYQNEVYSFYDSGLTRKVYVNDDKTKVIKILIDPFGFNYNKEEYNLYNSISKKEELAKTEISEDNLIVIQEFVTPVKFSNKEYNSINEITFANSCRNEVGWNKNGKLVCFDLNEYKKW